MLLAGNRQRTETKSNMSPNVDLWRCTTQQAEKIKLNPTSITRALQNKILIAEAVKKVNYRDRQAIQKLELGDMRQASTNSLASIIMQRQQTEYFTNSSQKPILMVNRSTNLHSIMGTDISYHTVTQKKSPGKYQRSKAQLLKIVTKHETTLSSDFNTVHNALPQHNIRVAPRSNSRCDPDELVESLKKLIPNADKDTPSNRQEAIQLLHWFRSYQSQLQSISSENEQSYSKLYQLAIDELIRQIQTDCVQRADVLRMIFKQSDYHKGFIETKTSVELMKLQKQQSTEVQKIKSDYEKLLKRKETELELIEQMKQKLSHQLQKANEDEQKAIANHWEQKRLVDNLTVMIKLLQKNLRQEQEQTSYLNVMLQSQASIKNIMILKQIPDEDEMDEIDERDDNIYMEGPSILIQAVEKLNLVVFDPDKEANQRNIYTQTDFVDAKHRFSIRSKQTFKAYKSAAYLKMVMGLIKIKPDEEYDFRKQQLTVDILIFIVEQDKEICDQRIKLKVQIDRLQQKVNDCQCQLIANSSTLIVQDKTSAINRNDLQREQIYLSQNTIKIPIPQRKVSTVIDCVSGKDIISAIKSKSFHKFMNFLSVQQVLKFIYQIYSDRMKNAKQAQFNMGQKDSELSNYAYNYMLKLYTVKRLVDQKFIIFILSVRKYMSLLRINMFAKFLNLLDNQLNYSTDEFNKYIDVLNFVQNESQFGVSITGNESEQRFHIPYIRALQYMGNFIDSRMTQEETIDFKKDIELLKEENEQNTAGIIDFDQLMAKMLNKYRLIVNRAKTYVIHAFDACDLDGNKVCNLEEFLLLNRHIESQTYDYKNVCKVFLENTDLVEDGEQCLSFDKFSIVCVENNLFSEQAQDLFLNIKHKKEVESRYETIQQEWPDLYASYLQKFNNFVGITEDDRNKWIQIIEVLDKRISIKDNELVKYSDQKPMLIALRILQEEAILISKNSEHNQRKQTRSANEQDEDIYSLLDMSELTN